MSIERRYQKRVEYPFDTHIVYRRRGFQGTVRNITSEGMFIQTRLLTIPTGNMIELEFSLGEHQWQISALVVHINQEGMGVVFRTPQPELMQEINRLRETPPPTHFSTPMHIPGAAQGY